MIVADADALAGAWRADLGELGEVLGDLATELGFFFISRFYSAFPVGTQSGGRLPALAPGSEAAPELHVMQGPLRHHPVGALHPVTHFLFHSLLNGPLGWPATNDEFLGDSAGFGLGDEDAVLPIESAVDFLFLEIHENVPPAGQALPEVGVRAIEESAGLRVGDLSGIGELVMFRAVGADHVNRPGLMAGGIRAGPAAQQDEGDRRHGWVEHSEGLDFPEAGLKRRRRLRRCKRSGSRYGRIR